MVGMDLGGEGWQGLAVAFYLRYLGNTPRNMAFWVEPFRCCIL